MYTFLMLADLGDPVSQFWIGVGSLTLSGLAILVTIIMAVRGRQKKLLTYEVVSNTSVINVKNDVGEDITLLLEGKPVTNVRLYVIKVLNAGNVAIDGPGDHSRGDYSQYPNFEFTSGYLRPVVRAAIHLTGDEMFLDPEPQKRQQQLKDMIAINTEQSVVTLKPPQLNPRQAVYLRVLLEADGPERTTITSRGQIIGGEKIKQIQSPSGSSDFALCGDRRADCFCAGFVDFQFYRTDHSFYSGFLLLRLSSEWWLDLFLSHRSAGSAALQRQVPWPDRAY